MHQKALDLTMTVLNCVTSINYFGPKGFVLFFSFFVFVFLFLFHVLLLIKRFI